MENVNWFLTAVGCCIAAITVMLYLALETFDKILKEVKAIREAANETAYYTKYPDRRPVDDGDDLPFLRD